MVAVSALGGTPLISLALGGQSRLLLAELLVELLEVRHLAPFALIVRQTRVARRRPRVVTGLEATAEQLP